MHRNEMDGETGTVKGRRLSYAALVLGTLKGMNRGRLRVTLPDGRCLQFGDCGGGFEATTNIRRPEFFRKCFLYGDIGFGEAYVDGDWETDSITNVISWFLLNVEDAPGISGNRRRTWALNLFRGINRISHLLRENTLRGSRENIKAHYDLSNEFFRHLLDPGMTYSSAYFADPRWTLEQAQSAKYDRLCRQLRLRRGDHVLEIGGGWGGFAVHAALMYGCRVTTVSVSDNQLRYARERVRRLGLEDRIEVRFEDYRRVTGSFDKIVSIEMLEAVGHRHMESFFAACHRLLKKDGLLALQVITAPDARYDSLRKGVDWIQKHIFPGSLLPSIARIYRAVNRTGDMSLYDLKDLGPDYARTLHEWRDRFNGNLGMINRLGFDDRFARKWNYYLGYCEAAFAMRNISVVQMIYTRPNNLILNGEGTAGLHGDESVSTPTLQFAGTRQS